MASRRFIASHMDMIQQQQTGGGQKLRAVYSCCRHRRIAIYSSSVYINNLREVTKRKTTLVFCIAGNNIYIILGVLRSAHTFSS